MRFTIVTLFPEMFESVLEASLLGRARAAGLIEVDTINPRDFTSDRHRTVDDTPYGGGPGMVMKAEPLVAAVESLGQPPPHRVLLAPVGAPLSQGRVRELAELEHVVLICGRYEGIDERVVDLVVDESISVGDFVMTGGEIAAMAVVDAVSRFVPGVLGEPESTAEESFSVDLLEYPQYTRPAELRGHVVPDVLLSGHHEKIAAWRRERALERTATHRPDLLARHLSGPAGAQLAERTYVVLAHHPVYDRNREVVTSSVTNLDIHDIARTVTTYGLGGYLPVTPVAVQRDKIDTILRVWREELDQAEVDNRGDALASVVPQASIGDAVAWVERRHRQAPAVVATSAREMGGIRPISTTELAARLLAQPGRPMVLLFGTGWGLTEDTLAAADHLLAPLRGPSDFNHLAVRSAVAAVVDRLVGVR